ncbi:hypothetical protein CONPUDRAFT_156966 [Coniophora puteana RWD-64-598 SS2]|uniref:Uncharacterized protein n=1 Tax=Coniophora puteana (strain RWD-64-598) TaxID=741705 RepID=A0A5M3MFT3_CONPW|nr:uncharacterized protein CONPUDRAFT_156966 [Coniophora puteana RWD-64-598 SS2]EIW77780.1 hypothetical protein CONPUDRAFT_156966 [Coniophora puteana RWD-64-598 SS2]
MSDFTLSLHAISISVAHWTMGYRGPDSNFKFQEDRMRARAQPNSSKALHTLYGDMALQVVTGKAIIKKIRSLPSPFRRTLSSDFQLTFERAIDLVGAITEEVQFCEAMIKEYAPLTPFPDE